LKGYVDQMMEDENQENQKYSKSYYSNQNFRSSNNNKSFNLKTNGKFNNEFRYVSQTTNENMTSTNQKSQKIHQNDEIDEIKDPISL